ncbi:putative reverse transcriptase domain-containing protein [Tanacetum coccineum]
MQQIQDKAKKSCMVFFRKLHSHLKLLSHDNLKGTRIESGFNVICNQLLVKMFETFYATMFLNMDQLEKQLDKEEFQEIGSIASFKIQTAEDKVDTGKAVDASLVNTESIGTESKEQDTSSRSGNDAHADDADIRPIYDEEPMAEVQTTAEINIFATGQQHTERPEFNNEGKVDQNVEQCHDTCPLPAKFTDNQTTELSNQSLESENIHLKKTVAQFQWKTGFKPRSNQQIVRQPTAVLNLNGLVFQSTTVCPRSYALSWKPCQGDSLNLPDHRIHKDGDGDASFQLESNSLPHAHAQTTKTYYKHQDSRIMKAQELKTKTSAQTLIYKIFLQRYQVYQGRLLASFQDDAKPEIIHETLKKIVANSEQRLQAASDRQRSYANDRQKPLEFKVGDRVMLKVSPRKGAIRFGKRGKLNPRYIRPFKILEWIGPVSYKLKLPEELIIMSSVTSAVTYTSVYTDSEPGRAFWGADDEEIPPVPRDEDEREPMFVHAHDPDYVPEPIYPEYIPLEHEHEFSAKEQPILLVDSPTAESPEYVTESDPEEDPEEYEDDEIEDGSVDYPMDGGDDDDGNSSGDDADGEDEDEEDEEEEEEEHLAPADSTIVIPVDEPIFPPEGTEPVIPPPSTDITIGARITIPRQTSISLPPEAEVERLLAMTTPSPSPLISLSLPSAREHLARCMALPAHSPPLLPSSGCPTQIQTLRISSTQALIDALTAALPLPPLPPLPPSLYIPPPVDRRDDIPESEPTRGRGIDYGFVSMVDAEERRQGIRDVGYNIRDTWVDPAEAVPEIAPVTLGEVNTRVTELAELHDHDTQDLYALLEDAQDRDSMNGGGGGLCFPRGLGLLDRIESGDSLGALDTSMQAELLALREQQRKARQPGPEARIPDHQDASGDADNGSHSSHGDNRRNVQTARPCFYADFMKCQPLNFKGTEGVVGLTRWIEKMESVFNISGCAIENQVKFATCTLLGAALTWWNLKVKGNDVPAYTERFQELTLICTKFVANETEKVDKYISGLPDNIYGNVKSARPKTLDETIELANDLMDQKLRTYAERQSDNKRKADDSSRNNHGHQQQPFKRQNVAKVYNMGTGEKKPYGGSLPKCTKCHLHHNGPCTQRCHKCNKIGHFARDCRSTGNTNVANTQKGNGAAPKGNGCFECGAPGHFKRDCPKLKNKDGGNGNAQGWVYAVGNAEKRGNAPGNPDANVVTGTFLLNNHYASILFDTGADRSFISTAFSSLINIAPTPLENCYDVELADGKLVGIDTIIRGCTLNFLDHPFNIDLMPVELGSFDVIIGMDWLRRCHAVIVCDEKLVQVTYRNETLTFCGNESSNG